MLGVFRRDSALHSQMETQLLFERGAMNVVWKYLNKRAGAVAALKDFGSMKFIMGKVSYQCVKTNRTCLWICQ